MTNSDILFNLYNHKIVELTHQCKTENGIEYDEKFKIVVVIGDYEQLRIKNQYGRSLVINPRQLRD